MSDRISWANSRVPAVTLEWYELEIAAAVGLRRNVEAMRSNRRPAHGMKQDDAWRAHVEGACGEMAVAKVLGIYWSGSVNTFRVGGDVSGLQVRTRSNPDYELIVRQNDRDDDIFVLVTGSAPSYSVRGWRVGLRCKRQEYFKEHGNRPGAFFVPQWDLLDIRELRELLHANRIRDVLPVGDDQPPRR